MIDISVIIPAYNCDKYINKCLDSLETQTINNFEIIVINDGSTDNTLNVLSNYSKRNNNIKVIDTPNNGIGAARNLGLKKSTGKYLIFVDADDYVSPNYLEKMLKKAKEDKADVVVCDMYKVFMDKVVEDEKIVFKDGNIKNNKEQIINIPLGPCGKLFSKSIIKTNFAENLKYEDVPFVFDSIINSSNTVKLNEALYYYRIHAASETTTMDLRVFDILEILNVINKKIDKYQYLAEELEYLNIRLLSRYNLQQKNQKSIKKGYLFINKSFDFLNTNFPNWRKNKYFNQELIIKRIIKKRKVLVKLFCLVEHKKM